MRDAVLYPHSTNVINTNTVMLDLIVKSIMSSPLDQVIPKAPNCIVLESAFCL